MLALERLSATVSHTPAARAQVTGAAPAAISVEGVSKTFRLPHQQYSTLKERVLHPVRSRTFEELRAVDDVTFQIHQGEFFGIVGRNGSGKSTLLKCMAGIYDIDRGGVRVRGRLSPFIELGVGFNPDLTARDNVIINAIMLGLTRKQARDRFDEIIDFAGLENFLDLKLKNYSSGMSVRLAFSVAVQVDADVLLVDEVLAVGDAAFQQKCFDEFNRMKDEGRTIVFVTHDMGAIESFCDRAMLMEKGEMLELGEPGGIVRRYGELNFGQTTPAADGVAPSAESGRSADVLAAWFEDGAGERVTSIAQGKQCRICFEVAVREPLEDPVFGAALRNAAHHTIFATSSKWQVGPSGSFRPGEVVTVRIALDMWLAPSRYSVTPSIARPGAGLDVLDLRDDLASLIVHGPHVTGGAADVPHEFGIERS